MSLIGDGEWTNNNAYLYLLESIVWGEIVTDICIRWCRRSQVDLEGSLKSLLEGMGILLIKVTRQKC